MLDYHEGLDLDFLIIDPVKALGILIASKRKSLRPHRTSEGVARWPRSIHLVPFAAGVHLTAKDEELFSQTSARQDAPHVCGA